MSSVSCDQLQNVPWSARRIKRIDARSGSQQFCFKWVEQRSPCKAVPDGADIIKADIAGLAQIKFGFMWDLVLGSRSFFGSFQGKVFFFKKNFGTRRSKLPGRKRIQRHERHSAGQEGKVNCYCFHSTAYVGDWTHRKRKSQTDQYRIREPNCSAERINYWLIQLFSGLVYSNARNETVLHYVLQRTWEHN